MAADLIIWDEVFANDGEFMEAAIDIMQENTKLVWLFIGDTRQTLPIVTRGRAEDIINATLTSSELWQSLYKRFLAVNRRLTMTRSDGISGVDYAHHCHKQSKWAKILLTIGEGVPNEDVEVYVILFLTNLHCRLKKFS